MNLEAFAVRFLRCVTIFWTLGIIGLDIQILSTHFHLRKSFLAYSIFWGIKKEKDFEHFQFLVNDFGVNAMGSYYVIRFRKINDIKN